MKVEKTTGKFVKKNPRVSVIIPLYNAAQDVSDSLDSVLNQSFKDYEIVVINDGSPDTVALEEVLERYFDQIVYLKQVNSGASVARNTAIREASGEIIAFLDHDDIWYPEYLEYQLKTRSEKQSDMIYCDALLFGDVKYQDRTFMEKSPSNGNFTPFSLVQAKCNPITSGTIVSRKAILDCGGFDETLPRIGFEDFDLWFRLALAGTKIDYHKKVLLKYRVRIDSLSGGREKIAERDVKIVDHVLESFDLSEAERQICVSRKEIAMAFLELERGKIDIIADKFEEAITHLTKAQRFYKSTKVNLVITMLKLNPKLTKRLLGRLKPNEYSM